MAGNARSDLVSALRSRLSDDRASIAAFGLQITANCKSALLEITNGFLVVTVEGGEQVSSIRWNLSSPSYSTVGRLVASFYRQPGFLVTQDQAMNTDHPSIDLRVDGLPDLSNKKVYTLRHRIFSDEELNRFLENAIDIHNPNYTISSVPKAEHPYVLQKAQAEAYRTLAADAVRRKNLDADAKVLLQLAQDLESQYERDRARMERIIPAPKADETKVGTGDAIQGSLFRRSLRKGYLSPYRSATPPQSPCLYQPADDDVEDITVRLRWTAQRDPYFTRYEVWRDTVPTVQRSLAGRGGETGLPQSTAYSRATTSKLVSSGVVGQTNQFDGFYFGIPAEQGGNNIVNSTYCDGLVATDPLEPNTTYYYRIYVVNFNGEAVPSEVIRVLTRPRRACFKRVGAVFVTSSLSGDAISPQQGPVAGGTSVTILGTNFVAGMKVLINGKECTQVSQNSTQIVVTTPGQSNTDFIGKPVDIVLVSPTGLKDIALGMWKYT